MFRCVRHMESVECVSISADGAHIATGGWDNSVIVWDNTSAVESLRANIKAALGKRSASETSHSPKFTLKGHTQTVQDVCWPQAPGAFQLFSASFDQTVRVWDTVAAMPVCTFPCAKAANSLSVSPSGQELCTAHEDGRVRVWDIRGGNRPAGSSSSSASSAVKVDASSALALTHTYTVHRRMVPQARWNPYEPHWIASVSHDGCLKILDTRATKLPLQTVSLEGCKLLTVVWVSRSVCATGGSDGVLRLHELQHAGGAVNQQDDE
mmetsp:Transcript_29032/g.83889  ORF Transcript_29032/g.83889 Transcript_29032/m.83889 type:complete len:266 (-) Transcript_29032:2446-3243(-)